MAGSLTISIEIELGWGHHDKRDPGICSPDRSEEEIYLARLLDACDEHEIPITFDIIGHLLLEACDGSHDGPHDGGWFDADPGTDTTKDPLFYWPSLSDRLTDRKIDHEIATHTFSHVLADAVTSEVFQWELERCCELHNRAGVGSPESIVTPRHRRPPYEILQEAGIRTIRLPTESLASSTPRRYAQRLKSWIPSRNHLIHEPVERGGIIESFSTPYPSLTAVHLPNGQLSPPVPFRAIPVNIRQKRHLTYLNRAVDHVSDTDGNLHLWTHLYNLSNENQWNCIESFFQRVGEMQRSADLEVVTMSDIRTTLDK